MKAYIPLICFISVCFASCQKELDLTIPPVPTIPNSPANDSIVFWKYVELDTTLPSGSDTTFKDIYTYDSQKRVKQNNTIESYPASSGTSPMLTTTDYFYNAGDTLPYKTAELAYDGSVYSDTIFYLYENGKVKYDSSIVHRVNNNELLEITIQSYKISGAAVYVYSRSTQYFTTPASVYENSGTVETTYAGGDLIAQRDTGRATNANNYQLTFDNKIDPYYKITLHYPVWGAFSAYKDVQKNNLTEEIASSQASPKYHTQRTYSYRADGYPVMVRIKDLIDPDFNRKGYYFYTK